MSSDIKHYNPNPQAKGKEVESVIWTTKGIDQALDMIKLGQDLKKSPFFEGNISIKKAELVFHPTKYEHDEWIRCATDILYFIEKYCKVKGSNGLYDVMKLRGYQYQQIVDYLEHDEIILGWSRQSGKTVGTAIYILWCMMFNADKHCAILANKSKTSGEILEKIQEMYKLLPFFLKAGVVGWNTTTIAFDNGCKVYTGPTTMDALNGRTCNILYIDEFAYVGKGKNKIEFQKDFLANAIPILASQKDSGLCKLIISSTPVGKEYFYELFDSAMRGEQGAMKASKVAWWQIPNRDLDWAKKQIAKIGITKFRQQFEVSFNVHSNTLLNASTMRRLQANKFVFEDVDGIISEYSQYFKMLPNVELSDEDYICLSVDISEGLGKDYSIIQMLRLEFDYELNKPIFNQIGLFSCNEIPIDKFARVVKEMISFFNEDTTKLLVEYNTYGDYFFKCFDLIEDIDVGAEQICMFKRSSENDTKIRGLRTNSSFKRIGVNSFKTITDNKTLIINADSTINQVENFQEDEKGNYKATIGHDDEVTPLVNFGYFVSLADTDFTYWLEDYLESIGIEFEYSDEDEDLGVA